MTSFNDFDLLPSLLKSLTEQKMVRPTEVQSKALPLLLAKKNVVGIAQTGSGKTLAFALPMLHLVKRIEMQIDTVNEIGSPRALVLIPTRELGEQIAKVFKTLTHETRLRVRTALGGVAMDQTLRNVSGPLEILIATPGRLVQLMDQNSIALRDVRLVIFDEADQMLDPGFLPNSGKIVGACSEKVQLGLFSATISPAVEKLIGSIFTDAVTFKAAGSGQVVKTLKTKNIKVVDGKRRPHLEKLLEDDVQGGTILFVNTREQCDRLAKELTAMGLACSIYRGEMQNNERRTALKNFRSGKTRYLVSTDLASRGLDIEGVSRVINYHMPKQMESYIHRVGRTARAGRAGEVFNFVTDRDLDILTRIKERDPSIRDA